MEVTDQVIKICDDVIEFLSRGNEDDWMMCLDIRIFLSTLHWYRSLEGREVAHAILMDLIHYSSAAHSTTVQDVNTTRREAALMLGESLLADYHDDRHSAEEKKAILVRLEALTNLDHYVVRDPKWDTRIPFARALHVSGNTERAREVFRGPMSQAIRELRSEKNASLSDRIEAMSRIGTAFSHLDDDVNALAAWSWIRMHARTYSKKSDLPMPSLPPSEPGSAALEKASEEAESATPPATLKDRQASQEDVPASETKDEPVEDTPSTKTDDEEDATAGAPQPEVQDFDDDPAKAFSENGPESSAEGAEVAAAQTPEAEEEEDDEEELEFGCFCGGCDKPNLYRYEFYRCRDCFDSNYCVDCYQKYKAGKNYRLCCDEWKCTHLYIPLNDVLLDLDDHVVLDGKVVPVAEWLDGVKKDWDIQEIGLSPIERFRAVSTLR